MPSTGRKSWATGSWANDGQMPAWRGGKPNVKWRFLNSGPKHIAMRHISAVLALALLLWAGCTQPSGPGAQNESAFLKAGCAMDNGDLNCSAAMERAGLGQCRLHLANISGLGTPVAECWRADEEGGNGIYAGGCMLRQAVTYVVPVYTVPNCGGSANCMGGQGGWGLQELRSRGDFASYFGPVKNGSMAIAYAAALTGDTIDYTGGAPRGARAFMKDTPPTAANSTRTSSATSAVSRATGRCSVRSLPRSRSPSPEPKRRTSPANRRHGP